MSRPILINHLIGITMICSDKDTAAHFSCKEEIPNLEDHSCFVEEGRVYTSRSAGDAIAFGLGLAARFAGKEKAIEVAETISLSAKDVP